MAIHLGRSIAGVSNVARSVVAVVVPLVMSVASAQSTTGDDSSQAPRRSRGPEALIERVLSEAQQARRQGYVSAFTPGGGWALIGPSRVHANEIGNQARNGIADFREAGQRVEFLSFTPDYRWVLVGNNEPVYSDPAFFASIGLSGKLAQYREQGKTLDVIAFAPNGEWIVLAENFRYYSSTRYFDKIGLRPKIEEYLKKGKRFDALAFASNGQWVLVAENFRYYSNRAYFDEIGLRPDLEEFIANRIPVDSLSISPTGAYVIIGEDIYLAQHVPAELCYGLDRIGNLNGNCIAEQPLCSVAVQAVGAKADKASSFQVMLYGPNSDEVLRGKMRFTGAGKALFRGLPKGRYQLHVDTYGKADYPYGPRPVSRRVDCQKRDVIGLRWEFY